MAGSRFVVEGGLFVPNNASNSTLNTTTIDGLFTASGNSVLAGVANLQSNVIVGGATLNVSSNATFTGNVVFSSEVQFSVPPVLVGAQVVNGNIIPFNNSYSLGNTSQTWNGVNANNVYVYGGNVAVGNATVNTFANSTVVRVSNSSSNVIITSSTITITGGASVNATTFSGTANNALYLGGSLASAYATNTYLQSFSSNATNLTSGNVAIARLPAANTLQAGIVQLYDNSDSSSTTTAPTANALRNALANAYANTTASLAAYTGTSNVVTVGTLTTGTWNATTIAVSKGGTGVTSHTAGLVYASGTSNFAAASAAQVIGVIGSSQVANATFASTAGALTTTNNYRINSLGVATDASGTSGEIRATNNITAYYSDMRLKKYLGDILNPLDKVKQLKGFYYTGNEVAGELGYNTTVPEVGVSAQDVQNVLPEIIKPAPIDEKYMTLDYSRIVPLLIEAIKELSDKVTSLEQKIDK